MTGAGHRFLIPFLAAATTVIILAAMLRGIWLDEFWSIRLGDASLSASTLLSGRWLHDTHPIFANLFYRAAQAGGAESVGLLRLILNLPALAFLLGGSILLCRGDRSFQAIFLVMTVSSLAFVKAGAEYRSYFWQLCAAAVLVQFAYTLLADPALRVRDNRTIAALGAIASALCIALHFVGGLIFSVPVAILLAALAGRKRWDWFAAILVGAVPAWGASIASALLQYPVVSKALDFAWIDTTTGEAFAIYAAAAGAILLANPIASFLALTKPGTETGRPTPAFLAVTLGGLFLSALLLLAFNAVRPVIVDRYLVCWQVLGCGAVAALASARIGSERGWAWSFLSVAALMLGVNGWTVARHGGWNKTRDFIARSVAACPATRVFAMSHWMLANTRETNAARYETAMLDWAYDRTARQAGFTVTPIDSPVGFEIAPTGPCPTLIWVEHHNGYAVADPTEILRDSGLHSLPGTAISLFRSDSGFVLIARKPPLAGPAHRPL